VVWWMDVAVGLIAIACGVARLVTSGWARHVAHLRGPVSTLQGR